MGVVVALVILIGPLIVLDLAALRWGADSRDGPNSPEWERRREWQGLHHH